MVTKSNLIFWGCMILLGFILGMGDITPKKWQFWAIDILVVFVYYVGRNS